MADCLLDGSYWATITPKRERATRAKKAPLPPTERLPKRKSNKPSQPLTLEQKERAKQIRILKREKEKQKIDLEHFKNKQKQIRKYEGCLMLDKILLGGRLVAKNIELLEELKIVAVLNVTTSVKNYFEEENIFNYKRIPVQDSIDQSIEDYFLEASEFLSENFDQNKPVLVHCEEGLSRSPTIVVAWMMKHFNETLRVAFEKFCNIVGEDNVGINDGFKKQLMNWDLALHKEHSLDFYGGRSRTPTRKFVKSFAPCSPKTNSPSKSERQYQSIHLEDNSQTVEDKIQTPNSNCVTSSPRKRKNLIQLEKSKRRRLSSRT